MNKTTIVAFVFASLVACGLQVAQAEPVGSLKHMTFDFDKEAWKVVMEQPDKLGNPTFGIMLKKAGIVVGVSEHPDFTPLMIKGVLLGQFEKKLRAQFYRFDPVENFATINAVVAPAEWSCRHYVSQSTVSAPKFFQSNCVFIGSGYWVHMSLFCPIDVSLDSISSLNRMLKTVKVRD